MTGAPALPGGTLTFLFADVEGSTRILETVGRARYAELLVSLGELLRETFDGQNGREIDTQGDAWFFVFRSALDALLGAAAADRAVAGREWPGTVPVAVRIGVHTGEAEVAGHRYFGLAVHRAARISAAAHGGQIVVSDTTRDVAEEALPDGFELRHLGEHRLKDLSRPERLFQLLVAGLPAEFPPLRSEESQGGTAFAGHEDELAARVETALAAGSELRASDRERDAVVAALREHTAAGRLTLEEFSERVDQALAATTQGELERVTHELPTPQSAPARRGALRFGLAVFGHTVRRGMVRLGRFAFGLSFLGDLDLDLRGASIVRGRSTVLVIALLGNADVYVPEGIDVEARGVALGGHVRDFGRDAPKDGSPHLRLRVLTLLGTADVWRVPPGAKGSYRELIGQLGERRRLPPSS